ncbi:MAG: DNA polymerase domain-containing protein [Candidatus Baltobacteraceae bacterium]
MDLPVQIEIEGRRITFARPEKWVWFDRRYTMLDLAKYYVAVSPWLLPHLSDRPIVYEIYPGTINGPGSFEQDPPPGTPRWVKRTKIPGRERVVTYVIADSAATLVHLVSLFMVSVHTWESTTRAIECPDFFLLDLDPADDCTLATLARAALEARDLFSERMSADALVKTSGARGLHVVVPAKPQMRYGEARMHIERLARELAARNPRSITAERDRRKRPPGTVYADWGQMGRGMSIVAPYSPRACEGAPVSMPVSWDEVERYTRSRSKKPPKETFARYNVGNVPDLLKAHGDLWQTWVDARRFGASAVLTSPHDA